jgi:hypothetical protein
VDLEWAGELTERVAEVMGAGNAKEGGVADVGGLSHQ